MSPKIQITFDKTAFSQKRSNPSFEKPEFKKFNMKFNNLDLLLLDAIAKREGVSRAQIINEFIENILKNFILSSHFDEALLLTLFAEQRYDPNLKTDKNFRWDYWMLALKKGLHPGNFLENEKILLHERIQDNDISSETRNLLSILMKEGFSKL